MHISRPNLTGRRPAMSEAKAPRSAATASAKAPAATAERHPSEVTVVPGKDALALQATPGVSLKAIAALYAPDYDGNDAFGQHDPQDAARYAKDLKKANHMWFGWLRPGKTLSVPTSADAPTPALTMAIAVQKSLAQRRQAGQSTPELDFTRLKLEEGPLHTCKVSVARQGSDQSETFYVSEDASGRNRQSYTVMLPSEVPFEQPRMPGTILTPGVDRLSVTVRSGQTLWSLAQTFAPTDNQNGQPDGDQIRSYIEAIKDANGLRMDTVREGQELALPSTGQGMNPKLRMALAVQKAFQERSQGGEPLPIFDYSTVQLEPTRDGATKVAFQLYEDPAQMAVVVKPDRTGLFPNGYDVALPDEAPAYFR